MTRKEKSKGVLNRRIITGILILIFLVVAFLRISLAFQSEFVDYEAYNVLRQVDTIKETGKPLFSDPLSFGGKQQAFSPLYHYILTIFALFMPEAFLVKIIPNIFAAAIVFPAFFLARHITKNENIALISSAMTVLVPATFLVGVNDASSFALFLTLMVTATYLFLKSRKGSVHLSTLIIVLVLMSLLHPASLIFLFGLGTYLLLLQVQKIRRTEKELEVFIFYVFFSIWFMMVMFKDAFVTHGTRVIWQNMPTDLLENVFTNITLLQAISSIGLVTLVLGAIALHRSLGSEHKKSVILLGSIIVVSLLLLWFRLIALETGLAVLATFLALTSSYGLYIIKNYLEKTKFESTRWLVILGIVFLFIISSLPIFFSSAILDTPSQADITVMNWAGENLDVMDSIMASPKEGFMIAHLAGAQNVMDENYLLVPRINERFDDLRETYRSYFKTDAIENMQKYNANYLYVSEQTHLFSGVKKPSFVPDSTCFILAFRSADEYQKVYLYKRTCSLGGEGS